MRRVNIAELSFYLALAFTLTVDPNAKGHSIGGTQKLYSVQP